MEPQEYEAMMRRMLEIVVRMDAAIDAQRGINERLTAAIERLDVTHARIETILKRVVRGGDNGREA